MTDPTPTPHDIATKVARSHLTELRDTDSMTICEIADVDLDDDDLDAITGHLANLADQLTQTLDQPATAELDAVAGGLDPEQEIRARAAQAAATALGPTLAAATPMTMQQFDVARERLLDLTETLIELIRTGSRP